MDTFRTLTDEVLQGLHELVSVNAESGRALRSAAETIGNADLARLLRDAALDRSAFAEELARYIRMNAEDSRPPAPLRVETGGGLAGPRFDSRPASYDVHEGTLLAEIERREEAARRRYEGLLAITAGRPVNDILLGHYRMIGKTIARVRSMRESRAA